MAHTAQIASRDVPRHFPTASLDDCDYHSVPSVSKALTSRGPFFPVKIFLFRLVNRLNET